MVIQFGKVDVAASGAIGAFAGVGGKYLGETASTTLEGAKSAYSQLEETSAKNIKSILPKSDGSNLSTRLQAAETTKQGVCSSIETEAKSLSVVSASIKAASYSVNSSGATVMGIAYDERVNNKK